jgi:hypothetical protein
MKRVLAAALACVSLTACRTVTIVSEKGALAEERPRYEESLGFGFWGLLGDHQVDVEKVCPGGHAAKLQTQSTATDELLAVVTLGLYMPRTARVWCAAGQE